MKTFVDAKETSWQIMMTIGVVRRTKQLMDFDLLSLVEGDMSGIDKLLLDPIKLADALYCVCKEQADRASISDAEFGERLSGDAIVAAAEALVEELVFFCPNRAMGQARAKVLTKAKEGRNHLLTKIDEELAGMDLASLLDRSIGTRGKSAA